MSTKLIARFQEPKLPEMVLLLAKGKINGNAPDSQGWVYRTVNKNGKGPHWSAWMRIGEVSLLHDILMTHLHMNQTDAERLIESAHGDGANVQERLSKRI